MPYSAYLYFIVLQKCSIEMLAYIVESVKLAYMLQS